MNPIDWVVDQPHLIVKRGAAVVGTLAGLAWFGRLLGRAIAGHD